MGRFTQGNLNDGDVIACWLLLHDTGESFEKLIETRKKQKHEELVQLAEDVRELGISKEDFERQGRVYLTAKEHQCGMVEAEEILTQLELKRNEKPKGAYAKIAKALEVPKYSTTEEGQKEKPQREVETLEWIPDAGTIARYNEIKRKLKEVNK